MALQPTIAMKTALRVTITGDPASASAALPPPWIDPSSFKRSSIDFLL